MKGIKKRLISVLLALYPSKWRDEYGLEFSELLATHPLGLGTATNVAWSALGQQARTGEPWIVPGFAALAVNLVSFAIAFVFAQPMRFDGSPSSAMLSILILLLAGFWTVIGSRSRAASPGVAGFKTALLSTSYLVPIAALMLLHMMPVEVVRYTLASGTQASGSFSPHYFAAIFVSLGDPPVSALPAIPGILIATFALNLPFAMLIGWVGGLLARSYLSVRRTLVRG